MTIGQAAASSGVPPKTIRFYEELGLVKPAERLANRYRAYDESNVQTLRFIRRARDLGFFTPGDRQASRPLPQPAARAKR
jgi:MerR family copper efflux transcriptional regulator